MKTYTTLGIYLIIFLVTGISFVFSLDKYFELPNFTVKSTVKDFDGLILLGLLLAFFNSLKELVQIFPIIKSEFEDRKKKYLSARRKEGKFEIEIDDHKVNERIHAFIFEHNFIEKQKRSIGDIEIGRQYFSDVLQEFRLKGENLSSKFISYVTFDCYSELPFPNKNLEKYIKIKCLDLINSAELNFKVERRNGSLHRLDIYVYFTNPIKSSEKFDISCSITIPYYLFTDGFECLYSNANYKKIDSHQVSIILTHKSPNSLIMKELNNKNEIKTLIKPIEFSEKETIFSVKTLEKKKNSKLQFEFERH